VHDALSRQHVAEQQLVQVQQASQPNPFTGMVSEDANVQVYLLQIRECRATACLLGRFLFHGTAGKIAIFHMCQAQLLDWCLPHR